MRKQGRLKLEMMAAVPCATVLTVRVRRRRLRGRNLVDLLYRIQAMLDRFCDGIGRPDDDIRHHQQGKQRGNPSAHEKILPDRRAATIRVLQFRPRLAHHLECRPQS